ncbi:MAG: hypothetical protein V4594_23405 [Bacteroidota bacterium]
MQNTGIKLRHELSDLKQLRIFVQLRTHIEPQFLEAMQSVSTFFKEENDIFYRRGEEKGIEKGSYKKSLEVARNFKAMGVPVIDIAKGTGLSIEEIEKL